MQEQDSFGVTESRDHAAVREVLNSTFETFTDLFAARLESAGVPSRPRAQLATAVLTSMRLRTGADEKTVDVMIDAAVEAICDQ